MISGKRQSHDLIKLCTINAKLTLFINIVLSLLDKHVPQNKQSIRRENNSNFVRRNLRRALIQRSKIITYFFEKIDKLRLDIVIRREKIFA